MHEKMFQKIVCLALCFCCIFHTELLRNGGCSEEKYETWQEVAKDMNLEFQDAKNQLKWEMPMRHTNL